MSAGWSFDGPDLVTPPVTGWSFDGPVDPTPDPVVGWTAEQWTYAAMSGEGTLTAEALVRAYATARMAGVGELTARAFARSYTRARLTGDGSLAARAYARLYTSTRVTADGLLLASAVIPVRGPQENSGAGPFSAPWWARLAHVILLSGGASGQTGSGVLGGAGKGGMPGQWAVDTIDLGQLHGTWQISFSIGQGGAQAANSDNAAPNPGGNTTATWPGGSLTATGGTGTVSSGQNGGSPGTRNYAGRDYQGGDGGTGNAGAGQAPGGAGAGGNGGIFGSRTRGGPGAPGQAWLVFEQ